jgi:hypothetical protein
MTVTLLEPGLTALFARLDSEASPLGVLVAAKAQQITQAAQGNVRDYFGSAPTHQGDVDQDVTYVMQGATATVGIQDNGSKSERLARYQAAGTVNWLRSAYEAVRFGG